MKATLYHNPRCGTSRKALALLEERGLDISVVEYLKTPPDRETLLQLAADNGGGAKALLRTKEALAGELGLLEADTADATIIEAIAAHPSLLNRPIVVTPLGTRICRPIERLEEILPAS